MRLQVTHRTRFTYAEPVKESFNEVRLQPTSSNGQICENFHLRLSPPANVSHYTDLYQNVVHLFEVSRAHRELSIVATSLVDTCDTPFGPLDDATPAPLSEIDACSRLELCHEFLQSSPYIEITPELWRAGLDITDRTFDTWQAALAIMRHIHREFRYQPNATHVNTRAADVLQLRAGVCQDFTHVMIGICRALKIPARYISGYLYNGPADQLKGAQASHAWVEVYIPNVGWCPLDPTNNTRPDGRYVKIGAGRDYTDVSPVRGTYRGTPNRTMSVEVLVTAGEPAASVSA
jgi:transglutaminase-like putative cysteine protease